MTGARIPRPCPVCGTIYEPRHCGSGVTKSCSPKCANELKRRAKLGPKNPNYGKSGTARQLVTPEERAARREAKRAEQDRRCANEGCDRGVFPTQRFCSPACAYAGRGGKRRTPIRQYRCRECGKVFERIAHRGTGAFCSPRCKQRHRWPAHRPVPVEIVAEIPPEFLRRDWNAHHPACVVCGKPNAHRHHVIYAAEVIRRGGQEHDPANQLGLCHRHHHLQHSGHERVPLSLLRDENYVFAAELFGAPAAFEWLRRRYAGFDRRHDLLLEDDQLTLGVAA